LQIYVPAGTTVTYVGYGYAIASGNTDAWRKRIDVNGDCVAYTTFPPAEINRSGLTISGEEMQIDISLANSGGTSNPVVITYIKLQGTGVPLFSVCDNCP